MMTQTRLETGGEHCLCVSESKEVFVHTPGWVHTWGTLNGVSGLY